MQISVSSWSFHKPLYEGQIRLWEIPSRVRELGFELVELQDMFLWPYGNRIAWKLRRLLNPSQIAPDGRFYDSELLRRVSQALKQEQMKLSAWNCDSELGRTGYVPDVSSYILKALHTASELGAPILRITMDHMAAGMNIVPIIKVLSGIVGEAERIGVHMALENHGYTAHVEQIAGIVNGVDSKYLGVCLDFGNFQPERSDEDFEALAPYAIHVHAKSREFDSTGEESSISYAHRLHVLKSVGYDGVIAIEYEGDGDLAQNIIQTRNLIQQYW